MFAQISFFYFISIVLHLNVFLVPFYKTYYFHLLYMKVDQNTFENKVLLSVSMLCGDWTGVYKNWEMDICFDVCKTECNESMNL